MSNYLQNLSNNKITIYYFSGTGNSLRIAEYTKDYLQQSGYNIEIISIESTLDKRGNENSDLHIFIFPVYAFGLPRIMDNFITNLPSSENKKALVICTMGGWRGKQFATGIILKRAKNILFSKGYEYIGGYPVVMPENFSIMANPPDREKALRIIFMAREKLENFLEELFNGKIRKWKVNPLLKLVLDPIYFFFRSGIRSGHISNAFKVNEKCNSCEICYKVCPTGNIKMINEKPQWGKNCELCFRCISVCPTIAIEYTFRTHNKRRYLEPHLKIKELFRR